MSLHRYAAKRDDAEDEIVATWHSMGAHSEPISGKGLPDRLVFYGGDALLVETKTGKRGLTTAQVKTFADLYNKGIRIWVVRTAEEARRLLCGTLPPWTPDSGVAAGSGAKKRAYRAGVDRPRTVAELCGEPNCPRSRLPSGSWCVHHARDLPPLRRKRTK